MTENLLPRRAAFAHYLRRGRRIFTGKRPSESGDRFAGVGGKPSEQTEAESVRLWVRGVVL